jgi:thioredoxin-related protein
MFKMKIKLQIIFLFLFLSFTALRAQQKETSLVHWLPFEKAMQLCKDNPRPVLIDVYTDWCGWCKVMMKNTFSDKSVAGYINNFFYPVRLNAETLDTLHYKDTAYVNFFQGSRSPHQLAYKLLDGKLSYPSLVYFDRGGRKTVVPGYYDPSKIMPLLVYFGENIYQTANYDQWENNFQKTFLVKDSAIEKKVDNPVHWLTLTEALEKNKKKPGKILIYFYTPWNVSCSVMVSTTWNNQTIASLLNEKFYPVRFDATSKDTLKAFEATFINEQKEHPFHQFPIAMLQGKMEFPAFVILDEENRLLDRIQFYLTPENIEPILLYFGDNQYKTTKWENFRGNFKSKNFKE